MIDEKKLIKEIRNLKKHYVFFYKEGRSEIDDVVKGASDTLFNDIAKIIDEQPKVGEWIPCSKRLPEEARAVEVTMYDGNRAIGHFYKSLEAETWFDSINGGAIDVIAWKEPSEPWEGGKE